MVFYGRLNSRNALWRKKLNLINNNRWWIYLSIKEEKPLENLNLNQERIGRPFSSVSVVDNETPIHFSNLWGLHKGSS